MMKCCARLIDVFRAMKYQKNWIDQVRYALGILPPRAFSMELRCGYSLSADYRDRGTCNDVWLRGMYAIPEPIQDMGTIIEIGGHVGSATLYFAWRCPKARIFVFEPSPRNFAHLKKNIERNALANRVQAVQKAVSKDTGTKQFFLMNTTGGNSFFPYETGNPITVQTVSLKDIVNEHKLEWCDLLKLDCEGAEYEILYNAPDHILRRIRNIVLEYHHFSPDAQSTPERLREFLEQKGFSVHAHRKHMLFAHRASAEVTS